LNALLRVIATGLWTGFFPVASGTAGSLLGVALYACVPALPLGQDGHFGAVTVAFLVIVTGIGVPASRRAEEEFDEDGGPIVIDEVVGQWITLAGLVPSAFPLVAGFVLFRIMDILKPFPARRLESLPLGWGVMADDVVAGVYAAIALRLLLAFGGGS
jgi:phosphatidylglycerophosphatase A